MIATVAFKPIQEEHLPAVLAIEAESNHAPWSEKSFRHELTNKNSIFKVAIDQGNVVGYGGVWLVIDEAHILTLTVRESYRRQGLGRALISNLLKEAHERGMVCATLEVRVSNKAAIALYQSLGFVIEAVRKRYYPDNHEDANIMWLRSLEDFA